MQLRLPWTAPARRVAAAPVPRSIDIAGARFTVVVARHRRARRYLLRVTDEGRLRLTVPRGGSLAGGLQFVASQAAWIAREWSRRQAATRWEDGTVIWHRGDLTRLRVAGNSIVWADERIQAEPGIPVRDAVRRRLRALAEPELLARCRQLSATSGLEPTRVAIRDQRSRWGSCSARGAIMLNWRLIQMPAAVSDYVILHELVHLEQPNHARRFWRAVERVCPEWRSAERWLRRHGRELM